MKRWADVHSLFVLFSRGVYGFDEVLDPVSGYTRHADSLMNEAMKDAQKTDHRLPD